MFSRLQVDDSEKRPDRESFSETVLITISIIVDRPLVQTYIYLSEFAKTCPLGFRLDSGFQAKPATLNPGGGGGVGLRQGQARHMAQWLAYVLVACWRPAVKSRGEGRVSCTDTPNQLDLEFSALNELDIDCVSGYFTQLFDLAWGFCVDMAPCWSGPCHVHAWGANLLARGVVRGRLAAGTVFESTRACFCEFG